jgi:hypothetical protein
MTWTAQEELEFEALFSVAWSLRGTDAYRAALETLVDWHADIRGRRAQTALAHRAVEDVRLVQLLRDTDPDRLEAACAAR